jgi:hypothetical protein
MARKRGALQKIAMENLVLKQTRVDVSQTTEGVDLHGTLLRSWQQAPGRLSRYTIAPRFCGLSEVLESFKVTVDESP